jgi:hypothetical protein
VEEEWKRSRREDLVILGERRKIGKGLGHGEVFQIWSEDIVVGNGFTIEAKKKRMRKRDSMSDTDVPRRQVEHGIAVQAQRHNRQEDHSECLRKFREKGRRKQNKPSPPMERKTGPFPSQY